MYCARYVRLSSVPIDDIKVEGSDDFDYELVIKNGIAYVQFTHSGVPYEPRFAVSLSYRAKTKQPKMGSTYYITAICVRPDSMYNTLIEVTSYSEGKDLLGPLENNNDLYVANEIAWRELTSKDKYGYVQIKDSDGDGVITDEDVRVAFECLAKAKKGTDIVLVNQFDRIKYLLSYNESQNDPFEGNENKVWIGFPSNYGVEEICAYSSSVREMNLPNFKVLIANNEATIRMETDDSLQLTKNLDGSFVAWSCACARRSTRLNFASSILRTPIRAFDTIKIFNISEILKLGTFNVTYLDNENSVYLISEDLTPDSTLEQITEQQIYVTRYMRARLNSELPSTEYDSKSGAILLIQSKLISNLNTLIKEGKISKYLDENGAGREIDANKDIYVSVVEDNPTQFQFGYGFYTKKGIKHLFGSYVLDTEFNK